jgi:hypothetical protein
MLLSAAQASITIMHIAAKADFFHRELGIKAGWPFVS